jgi:phage-related protein
MEGGRWTCEFYETVTGRKPVVEYLDGLPDKARAKLLRWLQLLEEYRSQLKEPYVRDITGVRKLKELRVEFSSNLYRVFFFAFTGRRFILLHAFTKKTPKTPRREIDVATMRMADYLQRQGGQS